jgi:hypothetical protein
MRLSSLPQYEKDGAHETHPLGIACAQVYCVRMVADLFWWLVNLELQCSFSELITRTFMGHGGIPIGWHVTVLESSGLFWDELIEEAERMCWYRRLKTHAEVFWSGRKVL